MLLYAKKIKDIREFVRWVQFGTRMFGNPCIFKVILVPKTRDFVPRSQC